MTARDKLTYQREYYLKHRHEILAKVKEYRRANGVKISAAKKEYLARNKERLIATRKQSYLLHKEKRLASMKQYRDTHGDKLKRYRTINQSRYALNARNERASVRVKVFNHYGWRCACCDEGEPTFLTIDHKNGGGNKHRKELKVTGMGFYRWLCKHRFPEEFQTLCWNCNMGRARNGSVCPHNIVRVQLVQR
jgi:hypothetical protein